MIDYDKIDQAKLVKADKICELAKKEFSISYIKIRLNMINEDINVELKPSEMNSELLAYLKSKLESVYFCKYKIKSAPILSGSYMDNSICKATALYLFEKI